MSRVALLVTGASGMRLPAHALHALAGNPEIEELHLVVSGGAAKVLAHESPGGEPGSVHSAGDAATRLLVAAGIDPGAAPKVRVHPNQQLDAEIASGSYRLDATIVLPCSSGTLGALAGGTAANLIHRAGLVALKERWPLVLGFRETPFNLLHIENMRRLVYAGATILPPIPAFYVGGDDLGRFLDAYVLRLLDCAGIASGGLGDEGEGLRWQGADESERG
jgi:4-hydroxy-3-polyprenylbenzoate decarboxylase